MSADDRVTFRGKAVGVCYQKAVRDRAAADAEIDMMFPKPADLSLKRARVRRVGRALAWKVISRYEWLGTLPPGSDYFGLFFGDYCGGVACYSVGSVGAAANIGGWLGCAQECIGYLYRGACIHWSPVGSAPKLINRSALMLAEERGLHAAIAYSDTDAGEIGTVYQAAGWVCLGLGDANWQWVTPAGDVRNRVLTAEVRRRNRCTWQEAIALLEAAGWKRQPVNPKWRYVKVLPPGEHNLLLLDRIRVSEVPYPKRAGPERGSGDHPETGGVDPTPALHPLGGEHGPID